MIARHPSQLYEAILEGPLLLGVLWIVRKTTRPGDGRIAASFLIVYGLFRFLVEFTREPDPQLGFIAFGWLTMGQLLSMLLLVLGIGIMFKDRVVATRRSGDPSLTNY
jgi:phosphatidylglycerol:prolipoprotein diacylglycerol transferase